MQVWNVLRAAHWKCRTRKSAKNWPSGHYRTTLLGYIFATEARIDSRKNKLVKQQYLVHMCPQYGELQPTSGWDQSGSFGHPCKFQRVSLLGNVTARQSSSERQPNLAAFPASRAQHVSDLHCEFALGPHHVSMYGRHPMCGLWD